MELPKLLPTYGRDKVKTEAIMGKVQAVNAKLGKKGASTNLEALFAKVKSNL